MKYNRKHATARWGTMGSDWEVGVNFQRLRTERFQKAQSTIKASGLGAVLCFNFDNIRYITGTHIGEWCRDKMNRYAICAADGAPMLFDPAVPAKRISSPWMEERMEPPIANMLGALPPQMAVQDDFAKQIKRVLTHYGIEKKPLGVDMIELTMLRALEKEGIEVVDGQQTMLDAREVKTADEIELLKQAAAMVDAVYEDIARAIRPGTRENELVAIANHKLYMLGSERVECVNSVSGARGAPHCHTFGDRIIQPGDMVYGDITNFGYLGYKTCLYRSFMVGRKPSQKEKDLYKRLLDNQNGILEAIKPGATTADAARKFKPASTWHYDDEDQVFTIEIGHGIGLFLYEPPIINRLWSIKHPQTFEVGNVMAIESRDGEPGLGVRLEDMIVVTEKGAELLSRFPRDEIISAGLIG